MATDWYYAKDGQQRGPFPESHVRQLAAAGQISPHDLVWHEGLAEWVAAQSLPGLVPDALPGPLNSSGDVAARSSAPGRSLAEAAAAAERAPEFPPWLAALLAVATLGLFSLWYTWRAASRYAQGSGGRAADAQGRPLGRLRHPAWVLLLSYTTLGVYFCYWVYAALRECGRFAGSAASTDATLMVVFPPYAVYCLVFRLPAAIERVRTAAGLSEPAITPSHAFLNPLMFLALPYLAMWYQELLNEAWTRDEGWVPSK